MTALVTETEVDEERLIGLVGQAVNDMGAALLGNLIYIGDRLGLFKALAPRRQ